MAEHSTLTGASLHECKGASSATAGYVNKATGTGAEWGQFENASVADGFPVQMKFTSTAALVTCSTLIPFDDTIPQSSEGTEVLTLAITPKSATNYLVIEYSGFGYNTNQVATTAALFKDSDAAAVAAGSTYIPNTWSGQILVRYRVLAGSTTERTYKIRCGPAAGTHYINGGAAVRRFGGVAATSLLITEYKAS